MSEPDAMHSLTYDEAAEQYVSEIQDRMQTQWLLITHAVGMAVSETVGEQPNLVRNNEAMGALTCASIGIGTFPLIELLGEPEAERLFNCVARAADQRYPGAEAPQQIFGWFGIWLKNVEERGGMVVAAEEVGAALFVRMGLTPKSERDSEESTRLPRGDMRNLGVIPLFVPGNWWSELLDTVTLVP